MKFTQLTEKRKGYTGFELDRKSRQRLLDQFPPKFPNVFAEHITYKFGVGEDAIPSNPKSAEIVGYAFDDSLEAFVVAINGKTTRPDGKVYHVTWSLDKSMGRKPVHSNNLVASGWKSMQAVPIKLSPKFFSF